MSSTRTREKRNSTGWSAASPPTNSTKLGQVLLSDLGNGLGPSLRTRSGSNKRKHDHCPHPTMQDDVLADHDWNRSPNDHPSTMQSEQMAILQEDHKYRTDDSWLPEKRILELILDTLQRRDGYEIFAEPVDPSEVEDYYEIIKEPMDFGTMRAKLHEGMYSNLCQFERDVFLIFENAMHFNSSATIYFRQARALEDLAKKVFEILKADPKNFELKFAAIRRRSVRKAIDENRGSNCGPCQKLARDLRSNKTRTDVSCKGYKGDRKEDMMKLDPRSTYNRWTSCGETDPTGLKTLLCVNQQDIGYKESLMLFVKDLGPTAQRVAKHKLQACCLNASNNPHVNVSDPTPNCQMPVIPPISQSNPQPMSKSLIHLNVETDKISDHMNYRDVSESKEFVHDGHPRINRSVSSQRYIMSKNALRYGRGITNKNVLAFPNGDQINQSEGAVRIASEPKICSTKQTKSPFRATAITGLPNNGGLSSKIKDLENGKLVKFDLNLVSCSSELTDSKHKLKDQVVEASGCRGNNDLYSTPGYLTTDIAEKSDIRMSGVQFTFDLPYLKSRLTQMSNNSNNTLTKRPKSDL